jgi:3-hydroxymyristoyl/3-hydroxydecanoyl-(acyl carrier protein) dehydratase
MGDGRALEGVVLDGPTARARLRSAHAAELCRGHFPGEPLVPGALLVGVMAELAGLLVGAPESSPIEVVRAVFVRRISPDDAIALAATRAGDRIEVDVDANAVRAARGVFRFGARA